jgi:hypothetical protein
MAYCRGAGGVVSPAVDDESDEAPNNIMGAEQQQRRERPTRIELASSAWKIARGILPTWSSRECSW